MGYKAKMNVARVFIYIFLAILFLLTIFPVWVMVINSTRSTPEIQQGISLLPSKYLSSNWGFLTGKGANIGRGFINSLIISVPATFLTVYFSMLTAYALKVYDFFYKRFLNSIIVILTIIPVQMASLIGFYRYMSMLNLLNSYIPLIIPAIASPAMVFFASQYLEGTLVVDLIEAARIEGASELKIFHGIVLPIAKPGAFTMAILSFVSSWNNFFTPFLLISKLEKYTLPMMVKLLRGDMYRQEYGAIYLGLTVTLIPIIIVYAVFSRYIISGISLGAIKD